jgi:hypothetical protein
MADTASKVVIVVCGDRAIQEAIRRIVEAAGCQPSLTATVDAALKRRTEQGGAAVLVLVDPLLLAESTAAMGTNGGCPVVAVPVRTSSTGVRRIAKRSDAAVRWLRSLIAERCAVAAN